MKKANSVKEFVEKIDQAKKLNPKDLSSDQDLTIALMNLISIEEHLAFTGAKTGKTSYYDLINQIRELRKTLMQQVIPTYEGEVWCISKHLLSTSMRLMEVATKQQDLGNPEKAYDLFNKSYDLYCLFWGLNMNLIDTTGFKWEEDNLDDLNQKLDKVKELKIKSPEKKAPATTTVAPQQPQEGGSMFSSLKNFVKKAVDCCIE
ncbi:MAG: hypothetical protein LBU87_01915 [Lactobacillales bacterium]|jgi:hypothetical protein|nr:hypothetical protein [Lactobacillales bacterium]